MDLQKTETPPIMLPGGGSTGSNGGEAPAATAATAKPAPVPRPLALQRPSAVRDAPDEVMIESTDEAYLEYRQMTDMREPYRIPAEYLVGTKAYVGPGVADTPLIVFINAKSGGRVGPRLLTVLFRSLGQAQVFDLAESRPAPVLRTIWDNLLAREAGGDKLAGHIRRNLRILAAGGDGTVTWILKTVRDLQLQPPPAVAILPLGTGNDLSLSFGWGDAFLDRWVAASQLYSTLKRFADARLRHLDCWGVSVTAPDASFFQELPYALQQAAPDKPGEVRGLFWNYLSLGLDAEAAYGFHRMREAHSWAASTRLLNQAWYSYFSCTSGWFCGAQPLTNKMRLRVRDEAGGEWREVAVPRSVRALVLLNLQSYGGGRDIVGLDDSTPLEGQDFKKAPIFDDGLIEVVGFGSGWHAALTMAQVSNRVHAVRLAQCKEVELQLEAHGKVRGEQAYTHMQMDGEPWRQPIPAAGDARQRTPRPAGLQESLSGGPPVAAATAAAAAAASSSSAAADGATQQGQQAGEASGHMVVVLVSHAGHSHMLLNEGDPQGIKRARRLASRGAQLSKAIQSAYSLRTPRPMAG